MPKTYAELLRSARDEIREVSPAEADALRQRGGVALIDVREASEWDQGHVPGAAHVSKSYLEQEIEAARPGSRRARRPVLRGRHPLACSRPRRSPEWATPTSPR